MKNLSLWQRLNLAIGLMIFLVGLAAAFALWMESARAKADARAEKLGTLRDRLSHEVQEQSDALLAQLAAPGANAERRRAEVESSFNQTLGQATKDFPEHLDLLESLDDLRNFAGPRGRLGQLLRSANDQARTNPAAALRAFNDEEPNVREDARRLVSAVAARVQKATDRENSGALIVLWIAVTGIVLSLGGAFFVARFQSRTVTAPVGTLTDALARMQRGDFTHRLTIDRQDEFGEIADGLNRLAQELSALVGQVQRSGIQVNSTATQISATAREQQSTANEIAATTAEIGATSKEISATSKELVKTMNEVSSVAEETAELAASGQGGIGKMEGTMRQIIEASGSISGKLAVLSEKTANINTVVTTITKVADQTNLLSLNAAIEAEKAGEYGLGFAVVAMEIRRLADQTAVATYDIEKMVKEMQSAVSAGVMGMDKFSEEVRRGVEEVRTVGTQLAQIIHSVQTLSPRFHTVNEGMHAQATGAQQISETLTQLNEAAQLTAESLRQSNQAIEQLNEAARGLQAGVSRFKLRAEEIRPA